MKFPGNAVYIQQYMYGAEFPVHALSSVLKKSGQIKGKFCPILQFRVVRAHDVSSVNVHAVGTGHLDIHPVHCIRDKDPCPKLPELVHCREAPLYVELGFTLRMRDKDPCPFPNLSIVEGGGSLSLIQWSLSTRDKLHRVEPPPPPPPPPPNLSIVERLP